MRFVPAWIRPLGILLGLAVGCGEEREDQGSNLTFHAHALTCDVPGMEAWLRVSGVEGVCTLEVAADNTVSGRCAGVRGRAQREFRIEYFVVIRGQRVSLAHAELSVDLSEETRSRITIDFSGAEISSGFDDDTDGMSNIEEFCTGRDPLDPNG